MSAKIKHNRGDVYLGNQSNLENGQLFISYVNKNSQTSNGHTYSEGQVWFKDPSDNNLTELANARSINSLSFKGYITNTFLGDFVNANEVTQTEFKHCHIGDFWKFDHDDLTNFTEPFYKNDILLITNTEYESQDKQLFRDQLKSVEYIRIPLAKTDVISTLTTTNLEDTIQDLSLRLKYIGELNKLEDFYNLKKEKGNTFMVTSPLNILKVNFVEGSSRGVTGKNFVSLKVGDLITYNGSKWVIIPSGQDAETVLYTPNSEEIDKVLTFEDWQKELLKSSTNLKEAIDILNRTKAQLDESGKVPYSQLPTALKNSLIFQGKFYPVKTRSGDKDDPENQNDWPTTSDGSNKLTGYYWIVDTYKRENVQYKDKESEEERIVELNTGDWVVWIEDSQQFEVLDNSDRITSFTVYESDGDIKELTGTIGFTSRGKVTVSASGNTITINGEDGLVSQSGADGIENYFPIYASGNNELENSALHQENSSIISDVDMFTGSVNNAKELGAYGNIGVHKTSGTTKTTYVNNFLYFDTVSTLTNNDVFYRTTKLKANESNNFATGDESIDVYLPEAGALLVGVKNEDSLTPNYHTKVNGVNGFITDTLTSEVISENLFEADNEDGYENIGLGRMTSEDTETGEITFYAKSSDTVTGFYNVAHSVINKDSTSGALHEHFLDRSASAKTHLVINPTVLEDAIDTIVKLPMVSGTIATWEEMESMLGNTGTPLMIPAWEEMEFRGGTKIGLDTSPITMRVNRKAHDNVKITRTNNLATDYGVGKKSAWSYIGSSKKGSLQDADRTSVDDFVSFDAWLEAQRAVASKEAFILPSTSTTDGNSTVDVNLDYTADTTNEINKTVYNKDGKGGNYQRILPSRTIYKNEPVYYEPVSGELIKQDVNTKDVEMPAVGGVLLTSRSRIDGGVFY